ncbi:MAG TPA: MlaD family protein [Gemmatimonadaceae bacterium]|jgi:phospholipid/cholesterol/gamma-HCH transport system substrate-binding protein|nr:MlaD family protein [Gemmatimonadaceae bacterium]
MKRRDEVLVGIVATAALALAIIGSLFLARGGLTPGYPVHTVFPWGAGLKQGQPVMLSGVTVGYVNTVDFRRDGFLVVGLRINKRYGVPRGTTARVVPNGFFGDMMVALQPTIATDEVFAAGDTIPAGPPAMGIGDVIGLVDSIGRDIQLLTGTLRQEFVEKQGIAELRSTVVKANQLIATLGEIAANQSAELSQTQASLRRVVSAVDSATVDSTVKSFRSVAANADSLLGGLRSTTVRLDSVLARLETGRGSAGMLLNDEGMYTDVRSLLQRLDSLTTDFQKNPRKYIKLSIF